MRKIKMVYSLTSAAILHQELPRLVDLSAPYMGAVTGYRGYTVGDVLTAFNEGVAANGWDLGRPPFEDDEEEATPCPSGGPCTLDCDPTYRCHPVKEVVSTAEPMLAPGDTITRPMPITAAPFLTLPDDDVTRSQFPLWDGCLAYFPNALAEVAKLSKLGNDKHNPGQPIHWAREKSTDHPNKILRHLIDAGKTDSQGVRHSAGLAWRALALLQEELERDQGLAPSPASKNRPW